jgi:hypothetical protein
MVCTHVAGRGAIANADVSRFVAALHEHQASSSRGEHTESATGHYTLSRIVTILKKAGLLPVESAPRDTIGAVGTVCC